MKRYWRRFLVAMLLGVAVYGVFIAYSGYQTMRLSLQSFHWSAFLAALGLATANYVLRFAKWEYYLARLEIRGIPKLNSFLIFLSGFVLTITPGKVGEVFKSVVLAETYGVAVPRTAPIVIAERLTDVIGVILLIALGSASFSGGLVWAGLGGVAVSCGVLLILWPAPVRFTLQQLEARPGALRKFVPKIRQAYDNLQLIASPSALLFPTLLSVIGWGCEGFALYLLLAGFGLQVDAMLATFFYATATLAGALVPVPGGLGVAETLLHEQLVRLGGVPEGPATAGMILIRFATLWWAVVVGFLALALLKRRFPQLFQGQTDSVGTANVS